MTANDAIVELYKNGYSFSNDGFVVNKLGLKINGYLSKSTGYLIFSCRIKGEHKKIATHRFIAYCKYGIQLFRKGIEVRHLDGIKTNNTYSNIAIGTHSQNMNDIPEIIRKRKSLHASSFLKKYDNKSIKEFYLKTKSYKKTMNEFNIPSKGTLHYIIKNTAQSI